MSGDHVVPRRRLGAVLFADVAGYSRLMRADEVGTWRAVRDRITTFNELARSHGGDVLQVRGDGLFLLFDSAVNAVSFAMEIQKRSRADNEARREERRIWFRIGINLGEVLVSEHDVSGDSVNVAARIESLAKPGEVYISAAVYDQVRNAVNLGYSYLGPQTLKNIADPVDVFHVHEEPSAGLMTSARRRLSLSDRLAEAENKGPSVVVLPFRFLGSDASETWLADGLTEDITTNLSRFHDLFVIARSSAYVYGEGGSPAKTARDLGVLYAVTGSVRKAGRRMRVAIQLIDAERERTIWGEQYDRRLDDIFDLQEEITEIIVAAIAVSIAASERERLRLLAPSDLRAYGFVLQGQQYLFHYTRDDNMRARLLYDEALRADPAYARAIAAKSRTLNIDWRYNWTEQHELALDSALDLALKAVELDPADARGYGELGFAHLYRKEHDAAVSAYQRALTLNPNDADLMSDMADALVHAGQSEQALPLFDKAMRLNPFYPDQYLWHLGGAYYKLRRYEEAVQTVQRMQNPTEGRRLLAASYAQLGHMKEARFHAAKLLEAHPQFSIEHWAAVLPDKYESDHAHFIEGLRKAGL